MVTAMTAQKHTPARIWACLEGPMVGMFVSGGYTADWPKYVRADVADELLTAGSSLMRALEQYGFPVSEAATEGLMKRGSLEAQELHSAAINFRSAIALVDEAQSKAAGK